MPSNAGIQDYARAHMPATYDALQEHQQGVVDLICSMVTGRLLTEDADENTLSAFAVGYVGKAVAVALVPAGIDHWAVNSRRTRGISRPAGVIGGNEDATNYDRVQSLKELKSQLEAELQRDLGAFVDDTGASIGLTGIGPGIGVTTYGTAHRTQDPDLMPRIASFPVKFDWFDGMLDWLPGTP